LISPFIYIYIELKIRDMPLIVRIVAVGYPHHKTQQENYQMRMGRPLVRQEKVKQLEKSLKCKMLLKPWGKSKKDKKIGVCP
jgi:hypothetical protein